MADLHDAAKGGNVGEVIRTLETVDANSVDSLGQTALHAASTNGHKGIVELLVQRGADVNIRESIYGMTPLHSALHSGHDDIARFLLESGADLRLVDKRGSTALHFAACKARDCSIVGAILEQGACIDAMNDRCHTALRESAEAGLVEVSELLVSSGASLHATNRMGQTPLCRALIRGKSATAMFLIASGSNVHLKDRNGNTALHWACQASDHSVVEAIIKLGADIDARGRCGRTPFMVAALNANRINSTRILDTLIGYGAEVYPKTMDDRGLRKNRALYEACRWLVAYSVFGRVDVTAALLDYGCGDVPRDDSTELTHSLCRYHRRSDIVCCFEQHVIKLETAGIRSDSQLPPDDRETLSALNKEWTDSDRISFRNRCELEIGKMKSEKVKATDFCYYDIFYLERSTYRSLAEQNVTLNWEDGDFMECLELFPIYGRLLFFRSKLGFKRASMVPLYPPITKFAGQMQE